MVSRIIRCFRVYERAFRLPCVITSQPSVAQCAVGCRAAAPGCRIVFLSFVERVQCLSKCLSVRRLPMCRRRTRAAKGAVPAASRRRFLRRFRGCPAASRPACAARSSATTCAAGFSAGRSVPRAVRGCSLRSRCAVRRVTTHSRGSRASRSRRSRLRALAARRFADLAGLRRCPPGTGGMRRSTNVGSRAPHGPRPLARPLHPIQEGDCPA
ncbi:hypothetical protein BLA24064_02144 [Burkholderia latens]|uniref:Uncharacterized protein n=1 Tax=Burkholderia latens TaxID=488446 RepID=A0A6P2JTF8_9BURK|nr:hypothetical protein BLA24064_02144 [Burkholderia latens]